MAEELQAGRAFVDLVPRMTPAAAAGAQAQVGGLLAGIKGKAVLAGAGIAGALAAPLSGLALFKLGETFNEQYRQIRIGTGQTGEVLKGLEESFRNVAKSSAAPFASSAQAISELNTRTGLTGKALEDLASTEIKLSRLTKSDLGPQIAATTRLFGDWSVKTEDQAGTLDSLFKVSQRTGIEVTTLSEKLVKFGAPLRQLGFTMDEAAAILGKFEKEGVNSDLVMGSMRIALGKLARAGEPAKETFRRIIGDIKAAGSASEANALALELFGARAGPDMAAAIREGRFEVGALMDQIKSSPETIAGAAKATSTFSGKLSVLKNAVAVAFEPLATRVYRTLNSLASKALPYVIDGVSKLAEGIGFVGNKFGDVLGLIGSFAGKVIAAFKVLGGDDGPQGFGEMMDNLLGNSGKYVSFFRDLGQGILDSVAQIRRGISGVLSFVKVLRTGLTEDEGTPIERLALTIREKLLPILKAVGSFISSNLKPILIAFGAVLGGAALLGVIGLVTSAVSALLGVVATIAGVFASPLLAIAALAAGLVIAYQRFEGFRNVVDGVVDFLLGTVVPGVVSFARYVADAFGDLVGWVEDHWDQISEAVEHAVNFIAEVVGRTVDVLVGIWRMWGDNLLSIAKEVWDQIGLVVETAIDLVRGVIEFVMAVINGEWGDAWDALKGIVESVLGLIVGTIENIIPTIVSIFSGAMELIVRGVSEGLEKIRVFFVGLPGKLSRAAGNVFGFLWDSFKGAINLVIRGWNRLEFKIPGFDPPGPGPKFGGFTLGLPNIPLLELGGSALRAGLGIVGDVNGRGGELAALPRGATITPLPVAQMIADAALEGRNAGGPLFTVEKIETTGQADPEATARAQSHELHKLALGLVRG